VSTRRLFFALWPSASLRRELCAATQVAVEGCGGRPIAPSSLHVKLAFLGSVAETALTAVCETARVTAGGTRSSATLAVTLDALDYWRRPQLLCAVAREAADVSALAGELRRALVASGFSPDLKPFRPHVTLARKVARAPPGLSIAAVTWSFTQFALIESRTDPRGSVYSIVDSWTLCGS